MRLLRLKQGSKSLADLKCPRDYKLSYLSRLVVRSKSEHLEYRDLEREPANCKFKAKRVEHMKHAVASQRNASYEVHDRKEVSDVLSMLT